MSAIASDLTPKAFAEQVCSKNLGSDLGRVRSKFVRDMLVGIQRSRSVNLTKIAKGLQEEIRLHATHKRLSRNLDDTELAEELADRLLMLGAAKVRRDTRLIVHMSSLHRKYASKVEYLPDAGADPEGGFNVCEIIASDRDSDTYTPLLCSVWSKDAPGFVSDADEVKKALRRVLQATDNKGMIYFDDRSMAEEFQLQLLDEPDFNFVAMVQVVDVVYRNKVCSIGSLLDSVKTPYGKIVFKLLPEGMTRSEEALDVDIFIHAGALAIKMPNSGRNLRLIAVKSRTRLFGGDICVPLITTETDLRSRKALMGLVESHLSLQDVLSAHQTLRNSLEPQSFRVMSYNRLQLLMTLLIGVMHYETATKDRTKVNHQHISQRPHRGDVARTYFHPQQQPASNNSRYSS